MPFWHGPLEHSYCQIFPSARYAGKHSLFSFLQAVSLMQKHDSGSWVSKANLEHCNTCTHMQTKLAILTLSPAPRCLTGLNAPTLVTGMSFLTIPRTGAPKMHHITHQHFNIGVIRALSSCLTKETVSRKFALATERPHG